MLKTLKLDTLEERSRASRLAFLWKITNDKVAVPRDELNLVKSTKPVRGLNTKEQLVIPRCRSTELKEHFVARTVPEWNRLSQTTTEADSVDLFKSRLPGARRP